MSSLRELHVIDSPVSYHTLKTLFPVPSELGPTSLLCPGLETLMCNCVIPGGPPYRWIPSVPIDMTIICSLLPERCVGKLENVGLPLSDDELKHNQEIYLDQYPRLKLYKLEPLHFR